MGSEVARMANQSVTAQLPSICATTVEKVMLEGDLTSLSPPERVAYYKSVCESLGLNPLTQPFSYLKLNGKMLLYAKRECTEQLRMIHTVSVQILARECIEGCYIVTARATLPSGRQDESIGAVSIEGLKGESRSNAVMKAETKAKRRVTLSICGLAFMDEAELDGVPNAKLANIDMHTGEIIEPQPQPQEPTLQQGATLHDDIVANPPKRKSTTPFSALEAFGAMKKRYQAIAEQPAYYAILAKFGKLKSNEFAASEVDAARGCYKEMSLDVADREVKCPIVTVLSDPIPLTVGTRCRFEGDVCEVQDTPHGYDWIKVK